MSDRVAGAGAGQLSRYPIIADTEPRRCTRMLSHLQVFERKQWRCVHTKTHEGPHTYKRRNRGEAPLVDEPRSLRDAIIGWDFT